MYVIGRKLIIFSKKWGFGKMKEQDTILYGIADTAEEAPKHVPTGKEFQEARFNDDKGYRFWLSKSPIRMYAGCSLPKSLTQADKGTIYDCAQFLETGTNMLFRRVDGYHKPLNGAKLAERLGRSERQLRAFLKKMYDMRIFACEDGRIYINPCYFFRGVHLNSHLFFLFEEDLTSVLPEWVVNKYYGHT